MHILYLHQYFRTPAEGGALRSYYISKALLKAGHRVTIITAHNKPVYEQKDIDGLQVHYLPVPYNNALGKIARMAAFTRFMWQSLQLALKQQKVDLVYATSTPLTVGVTALMLKKIKGWPYIFEVRDLWPEAPIQLGYLRSKPLIATLRTLERQIYKHARHIIALSPGMEQGVRQVAPEKHVSLLPNMADCDYYQPAPKPGNYLGLPVQQYLVISYCGAMGRSNRLEFLLKLAEACSQTELQHKVLFFIAGEGAEAAKLQQQARQQQLSQVHFLGKLNREQVRELLAASDATYTSFDTQPVLQTNSPNKFFDSLAAGKVCLVNTQGWLRELVEQHSCGFYADPLDPAATLPYLRLLLSDQELLREMQQNARQLAEREFSREDVTAAVVQVVEAVAKR